MIITQQVEFPDVSFYQGDIDFSKIGNEVILRAGQNLWIDPKFEINRSQCISRGINLGIYWFYDDRIHPDRQADLLYTLFSNGQPLPNMGIWCDWERTYGGAYSNISYVVQFIKRLELLLPAAKLGVYTGYYWFTTQSSPIRNAIEYNYLKDKGLWLAWYTSYPAIVQIPKPWTKLDFWQYGTPPIGSDMGVQTKEVDMNWFNGTIEEFNEKYGANTPTGGTMKGKMLNYTVNIRNSADAIVGTLKLNDCVYGDIITTNRPRIHFSKVYRANGTIENLGSMHSAVTTDSGSIAYMVITNEAEPGGPQFTHIEINLDGHKPFSAELEKL